jgi:hypothetical protein
MQAFKDCKRDVHPCVKVESHVTCTGTAEAIGMAWNVE